MAVIINEFELVLETPQQAESDAPAQAAEANQAARLSPYDLQMLMQYEKQRQQRIAAH